LGSSWHFSPFFESCIFLRHGGGHFGIHRKLLGFWVLSLATSTVPYSNLKQRSLRRTVFTIGCRTNNFPS
jgi:hypothetical protein